MKRALKIFDTHGVSDGPPQKKRKQFNLDEILRQLKQAYDHREVERQVLSYQKLGYYYFEEKNDPVNAIALYNFALALVRDEQKNTSFKENIKNYQDAIIEHLKKVEESFLLSVTGKDIDPSDYALDQAHQDYLRSIREEARAELIRHETFIDSIRSQFDTNFSRLEKIYFLEENLERNQLSIQQIYRKINEQLRSFVRLLIEECKQVLGFPLCEYAVVCFGSLARDEATPYSDLEFGILLEEGQDTEENKQYFRYLTNLLNIKILNLGETTPRMQDIPELGSIGLLSRYSESPTKPGFSFDGNNKEGRKTPLGNYLYNDISEDEKYELIQTPRKMAEFHNKGWYQKDKHLSTVLMTAKTIEGNEILCEIYIKEMLVILQSADNSDLQEEGSLTKIPEQEQTSFKTIIQKRSLKLLKESVDHYKFRGGRFEKQGHFFDIKYHLYRLPNMLMDHLSAYFGILENSLWNRIEKIFGSEGIIPYESALLNVSHAVSGVLQLRLRAYLNKDRRDNRLILSDMDDVAKNEELIMECLGINKDSLFELYSVLNILEAVTENFIAHQGEKSTLKREYYDPTPYTKGRIYEFLLNYNQAIESYKQAEEIFIEEYGENDIYVADVRACLGIAYARQGSYLKALPFLEKSVAFFNNSNNHQFIFSDSKIFGLNNLGTIYRNLGQYDNALKKFEEAQKIILEREKDFTIQVDNLINIADIFMDRGDYELAFAKYKQAEQICILEDQENNISVIRLFIALGNAYEKQAKNDLSLEFYNKAKQICIREYGAHHPDVANILNNMANVYGDQEDYKNMTSMYEEAREIYKKIPQLGFDSQITCLINQGAEYAKNKCHKEAVELFNKANEMITIFRGRNHISSAEVLLNIGKSHGEQGENGKALVEFKKAKRVIREASKGNHILMVSAFVFEAEVQEKNKNHSKSFKLLKKAERILSQTSGNDPRLMVSILRGLGDVCLSRRQYIEAIEMFREGEKKYREVYRENYSCVADILNNLGLVYLHQENYQRAFEMHEKVKKITENFTGINRFSVFNSLYNLGCTCLGLKQFEKARDYYQQAIQIADLYQKDSKKSQVIYKIKRSYIKEGNNFLLHPKIDIESARRCYQIADLGYDPGQSITHQILGKQYYDVNNLIDSREHYQILVRLDPENASVYQLLARLTHARAQIEKNQNNEIGYQIYLKEAEEYFKKSSKLSSDISISFDYAQFMWFNHLHYSIIMIVEHLNLIVSDYFFKESIILEYSMMERSTVDSVLQDLIDQLGTFEIWVPILAYYLLIQIYIFNDQIEEAKQVMPRFQKCVGFFRVIEEKSIDHCKSDDTQTDIINNPEEERRIFEDMALKIYSHEKIQKVMDQLLKVSEQSISQASTNTGKGKKRKKMSEKTESIMGSKKFKLSLSTSLIDESSKKPECVEQNELTQLSEFHQYYLKLDRFSKALSSQGVLFFKDEEYLTGTSQYGWQLFETTHENFLMAVVIFSDECYCEKAIEVMSEFEDKLPASLIEENGSPGVEIILQKDFLMDELFDNLIASIEKNTSSFSH